MSKKVYCLIRVKKKGEAIRLYCLLRLVSVKMDVNCAETSSDFQEKEKDHFLTENMKMFTQFSAECKEILQKQNPSYEEEDIDFALETAKFYAHCGLKKLIAKSEQMLKNSPPGKIKSKNSKGPQHRILDHLFLASLDGVLSEKHRKMNKINYVITLMKEKEFSDSNIVDKIHADPEIAQHKIVNVADTADGSVDLGEQFMSLALFIHKARIHDGTVLVHCHAGRSRSATIIIAYLMLALDLSLKQAFEYVKICRSIIQPNPTFYSQLQNLEMNIQPQRANFRYQFSSQFCSMFQLLCLLEKDRETVFKALKV